MVFAGTLKRGNPPDDWPTLLMQAEAAAERLTAAVADPENPG
jgi:hypothetical protein